ncbi:MAG: rhamnulokinase [Caldilineaceae bacterium]|nr:rhamnulokinase [Caldilineaceae bacterium]
MTTTNFIAADLGASNGRVLLARWDGARFALEELHRFANGPVAVHDRLYWDALGLWREIKTGLERYAATSDTPPAAIGLDTWGVDYALLDVTGRLLGNPVHYRDARTNGVQERLMGVVPAEKLFGETGIQFMQINTLIQLYAMREQGDPQLDQAATLLMIPDLFNYWMTGRRAVEYTIASTTQMLHAADRRWATGLLAKLGLPTQILPEILPPGTSWGTLLPSVCDETGIKGAPLVIAPGTHDTASAVAAIPGLDERSAYISSGTWSLMGVEIAQPILNDATRRLNFTNEGGVANTIRLLKNIGGLWLLQESRRQWARGGHDYSWAELLAQAEQATPFRSIIDPDASDFMAPGQMVDAICASCLRSGQSAPETVGEVVRCALESLALRYRWTLGALEELVGHRLDTVRIVGGGSQNRLLCQLTADACQRPVVTGPVEATALGNVMVQAMATGHLGSLAEARAAVAASISQEEFTPGPAAGWDDAFGRFQELVTQPAHIS